MHKLIKLDLAKFLRSYSVLLHHTCRRVSQTAPSVHRRLVSENQFSDILPMILMLFLTYISYVVDLGVGSKTSVDAFVYGIFNLDLSPGM